MADPRWPPKPKFSRTFMDTIVSYIVVCILQTCQIFEQNPDLKVVQYIVVKILVDPSCTH